MAANIGNFSAGKFTELDNVGDYFVIKVPTVNCVVEYRKKNCAAGDCCGTLNKMFARMWEGAFI